MTLLMYTFMEDYCAHDSLLVELPVSLSRCCDVHAAFEHTK